MVSHDSTWELAPHSHGKHRLLASYLACWLPILGSHYKNLLIFDGFAGPGKYTGGEDGSPSIILDAVAKFHPDQRGTRVHCIFVESDPDRFESLRAVINALPLPGSVAVHPVQGEFAKHVQPVLQSIKKRQTRRQTVPSFFVIDPFGIKGVPFQFFSSLLALDKSELLFSFMWESIERFNSTPEFAPYMRELMGNDDWRGLSGDNLKAFVYDCFEARLRATGAKYVLVFDLWNGGNHVYSLFFATKGVKGCDVMKQAIWKVDPTGSYSFRGKHPDQLPLAMVFSPRGLEEDLRREFGTDWTSVEDADEFVQGDGTRFHSGHLKQRTLAPLEKAGAIEVDRPGGSRQFSSGKGIRFRFVDERRLDTSPPRQSSLFRLG